MRAPSCTTGRRRDRRERVSTSSGTLVTLMLAALAVAPGVRAGDSLASAAQGAKPIIDWRLRYEGVHDAAFAERARAVTSRVRAGVRTGTWHATSLLAEAVWIDDPVGDYNSTTNGRTAYPVVADPAGFVAVNRFALINEALPRLTFTLGRQRINLDDMRFVGSVGWRQNEQTFDALRGKFTGTRLTADITYANRVNRIFGPDSPAGAWHGNVVLANVSHGFSFGRLTAFDYRLDLRGAPPAASTNTVGFRLAGEHALERRTATYRLSYAGQTAAGRNPADFSVHYTLLEGGLQFGKLHAALGRETLASSGTHAFQTPLATLHAFQGWADKFLQTPTDGIEDTYVKLAHAIRLPAAFEHATLRGEIHDFRAASGPRHYGNEVDVMLVAVRKHVAVTLKFADYSADTFAMDTQKLWLAMDYRL